MQTIEYPPKRLNRTQLKHLIREAHYARRSQVHFGKDGRLHTVLITPPSARPVALRGRSFLEIALSDPAIALRLVKRSQRIAAGKERHARAVLMSRSRENPRVARMQDAVKEAEEHL